MIQGTPVMPVRTEPEYVSKWEETTRGFVICVDFNATVALLHHVVFNQELVGLGNYD